MISIVPLLVVVPVPMCRKCNLGFCTRRLIERKLQMILQMPRVWGKKIDMLKTADTNKANRLSKLNILLSAKEFPSFWMDEKGEEFCINIYCFTYLYVCHTVHYLSFLSTLPCKRLMWMSSSVSILQTLFSNPTATKINLQIFPPACLLSLHCTCTCSSLPPVWSCSFAILHQQHQHESEQV